MISNLGGLYDKHPWRNNERRNVIDKPVYKSKNELWSQSLVDKTNVEADGYVVQSKRSYVPVQVRVGAKPQGECDGQIRMGWHYNHGPSCGRQQIT